MLNIEFHDLELSDIKTVAADMKERGFRYAQMLAVNLDEGVDLQYSYVKGSDLLIYTVPNVAKGTKVPSVSDIFLEAFVFENETHDLFGVEIEGIAIDFGGNFYAVAQKEPMTIISPEQKAAREKAAKAAAAKAAREAKKAAEAAAAKAEAPAEAEALKASAEEAAPASAPVATEATAEASTNEAQREEGE